MKSMLARLVPDRLAARFALLLGCALLVANLVALVVLTMERSRLGREARDDQAIERIVGLVPALEAVEPRRRQVIAAKASTRFARINVEAYPRVEATALNSRARALSDRLSVSLAPREVRIAVLDRRLGQIGRERGVEGVDTQRGGRRGEVIVVSIALLAPSNISSGSVWLNMTTRVGRPGRVGVAQDVFVLILGLSLASVLGVGLLFVRQLTRPLATLAEAARSAGRGDRSARVPEQGAREMRAAASAFNSMQAKIARFDAERTRTLAAVGHDLRTPITSLRIRAEMLPDDVKLPMIRTLDEMTVMADGLVAFARGDSDVEKHQRVDLEELLRYLCEERGARFQAPGVTSAGDLIVLGRPVALARAIGNLVDNAIRYGVTARVQLSLEGEQLQIDIDDEGSGIAEERLSTVFEPFVRGDDSRSAETGGAGLGLSIARSILLAHGGNIELFNLDPRGLRVRVRLPSAG